MYLLESDLLHTLCSQGRHHDTATKIFKAAAAGKIAAVVSDLSFQELDLLIKTKKMEPAVAPQDFFIETIKTIDSFGVGRVPVNAYDTAQSIIFRKKYGLSFHDSYYAAQAFRLGLTLLSFDMAYAAVKEIGYENPQELAEKLER